MALKLISVNIEGHRHLERLIPFLQSEAADIICLQEVYEADLPTFEIALGMHSSYSAMANVTETSIHQSHALGSWGLAQFTNLPVKNKKSEYYFGSPTSLPIFLDKGEPNSMNRILMHTTVLKDEQPFTVATTHFTWSVRGMYSAEQARDAKALLKILDTLPEVILCGDLNSPRDGEPQNLFNTLANRYTDTMPQDLKTSIDGQYHKAGQLMMMVDALFTSNVYQVKKIKIVEGISDHKGIVADIEKR